MLTGGYMLYVNG